ncbi:MAG: hypothetical protein ACR2PA_00170 [Hyphomicrobiaceae bacterium]
MSNVVPFGRAHGQAARPILHLSGPKLRAAMDALIMASDGMGGVEQYAKAVKLKADVFKQLLGDRRSARLSLAEFEQLVAFMSTVRRRVAKTLEASSWHDLRLLIDALLDGAEESGSADQRIEAFVEAFPRDRQHRFVRDFATEVLHNVFPEQYPMMNRWVWDAKSNTGVLREIWHGEDVDHCLIDVPDSYETFLVLREELSQFLSDNGIFRDMIWYVDLLCAQIYGDYINAQGGSFLRTEFASEADPLEQSRRILGLDGIDPHSGRSRLKTIAGKAHSIKAPKQLN